MLDLLWNPRGAYPTDLCPSIPSWGWETQVGVVLWVGESEVCVPPCII